MLVRAGLTDCIPQKGWDDSVIREARWGARYDPLMVGAVEGGICPEDFQERVQEKVPFPYGMNDSAALLDILDELTHVQAVREQKRAVIEERQGRRGNGGGRTKGIGSGDLKRGDASHDSGRGGSRGVHGSGIGWSVRRSNRARPTPPGRIISMHA